MDERIRALTIGPPAYALRKRTIEDYETEHVQILVDLHDDLVEEGASEDAIARALASRAAAIDVSKVNRLVALHNRWYPVEANLAMDRHGNFLVSGRVWTPELPYDAERLVALAVARISTRQPA